MAKSIHQKREIAFKWFQSKDKIKDLDFARGFVRSAANDLDLRALRKQRNQTDSDAKVAEIDEKARALIDSYRRTNAAGSSRSPNRPKDVHQKREIAFRWFQSREKIKDLVVARRFVRFAADDLDLRELRKQRHRAGSDETIAEIDGRALALINGYLPPRTKAAAEDGGQKKRKTQGKMDRAAIRALLVAFFDDNEKTPLVPFLRRNGAMGHRKDILQVANSTHIRKLRRRREDDGVRDAALAKIDEFYGCNVHKQHLELAEHALEELALEKTNDRMMSRKVSSFVRPDQKIRPLLVEWFNNPKKSVIKVLEENSMLEEEKSMRMMIRASGLQGKRKTTGRAEAMEAIDALFSASDKGNNADVDNWTRIARTRLRPQKLVLTKGERDRIKKLTSGLQVKRKAFARAKGLKRAQKVVLTEEERDRMKKLLSQWFYDGSGASVAEFIRKQELEPELRPQMVHAINRLGLRKVRREERAIRRLVSRRIENAFGKKETSIMNDIKKGNTDAEAGATKDFIAGMKEDNGAVESPNLGEKMSEDENAMVLEAHLVDEGIKEMSAKAPVFDVARGNEDQNNSGCDGGAGVMDVEHTHEQDDFIVVG
uniref:Uncharacterized protein n=1 Tax=Corethron hystrix TaxID=216773 RepID=A0A7S1BUW3_9STRA|mmetsp:Transcript_40342/g.94793  ORF Transcript_40342/g.94793 Transcript_40342/m.94793 type:complete len:599 (+) Transcript_40342:117-1913(+)